MSNNLERPNRYLLKLAGKLFVDATERTLFINALMSGAAKPTEVVLERGEYRLDSSSVFCGKVFSSLPRSEFNVEDSLVLDVCAAPGGKSVLFRSYFAEPKLVSNEVVESRARALISNVSRLKLKRTVVTKSSAFKLKEYFLNSANLVILDAPCSGQSLLAKGVKVPGAFHPVNIRKNVGRQRKLIAISSEFLKNGGYLAYMTCTFSLEENEEVVDWFLKHNKEFKSIFVEELKDYQSNFSSHFCYRLFPHQEQGAGSFVVLLKKTQGDSQLAKKPPVLWGQWEN